MFSFAGTLTAFKLTLPSQYLGIGVVRIFALCNDFGNEPTISFELHSAKAERKIDFFGLKIPLSDNYQNVEHQIMT